MSPCVGGKSESIDCVSSVPPGDLVEGGDRDGLVDPDDTVDADLRGGSCEVLEAR